MPIYLSMKSEGGELLLVVACRCRLGVFGRASCGYGKPNRTPACHEQG
jgi:hypothetical protein